MVKRKIVKINEELCNGCGQCIPNCHEGAIQMIDGKARLISDLFCDGLGNCLGHCPVAAITIEEREAEPYDEKKVMEMMIKAGTNTIKAHLNHLQEHGEDVFLKQALEFLKEKNIKIEFGNEKNGGEKMENKQCGCPGSKTIDFSDSADKEIDESGKRPSQLKQWPVQMHLVNPNAPYYRGADVLLAADCVAFSLGEFHKDYLKGKSLAIACPKLDSDQDVYVDKITSMVDEAKINTLTVMIMEVPCCGGLLQVAKQGVDKAERNIPIKAIVVGVQGNIIKEDWV